MKTVFKFTAAALCLMTSATVRADSFSETDWKNSFDLMPPDKILPQLGAEPDSFRTPSKGVISDEPLYAFGDFFSYACDVKNDKGHSIPSVAFVILPTASITSLAVGAVEAPLAGITAMLGEGVATISELGDAPRRVHKLANLPAQQLLSWNFSLSIAAATSPPMEVTATGVDAITDNVCKGFYALGNAASDLLLPHQPAKSLSSGGPKL